MSTVSEHPKRWIGIFTICAVAVAASTGALIVSAQNAGIVTYQQAAGSLVVGGVIGVILFTNRGCI